MLINGVWFDDADYTMRGGRYRRQPSALPQAIGREYRPEIDGPSPRLVFVASQSCPWSHAATIVHALNGLESLIPIQLAGGPRTEGYRVDRAGPLAAAVTHVHELYSLTDESYTGRATVPLLWDAEARRILSNDSTAILRLFDRVGSETDLRPATHLAEIDTLLGRIHDGLANAVYRAGKAQRQDEYQDAVDAVFDTLAFLDIQLAKQDFLTGAHLTEPDVRLFATLVRFDTVYATHFRCTRHRLTDFRNLWRFTRDLYRIPAVRGTVDFNEIRSGYYLNDGVHNPHRIVAEQPVLDW